LANWKRAGLWVLAVIITLSSAVWQRTTGPTYPARGEVTLGGQPVKLKLFRTHPGEGDLPVGVKVGERDISGLVAWRRYPTQDPWQALPMARKGDTLEAFIPHLPPAGKVEYKVRLTLGPESAEFPPRSAVARFRGEVSPYILIPHILCMFLGMLFSNKAGLDALLGHPPRRLVWVVCLLIGVGGFLLGPAVQKMAFDAWWTGLPFGHDLTDNKTLIAGVAWIIAAWRLRSGKDARWAIVIASAVTLVVFAIPHSAWGSQIHWDQEIPKG
jgi:hypothetical protein